MSVSTTVEIKGIDKTKAAFASVNKSMGNLKSSLGGLKGAIAGLIGIGGLTALASEFRQTADQIGKVSDRLGIGTSDLQKFQIAASQGGMDVRTFNMALQRFTRRTAEAAIGTGEAKDVIAEMGLQLRDNEGNLRNNADLLMDVSKILSSDVMPQADKVRIAFKLFDSEGAQLINTLQKGPEAIMRVGEAMEDFGVIIDRDAIKSSETLGDRMEMIAKKAMNLFAPAIVLANKALDPFFEKTELASLPLPKLQKKIQLTINELVKKRDALKNTNKEQSIFSFGARGGAKSTELQRKAIQKQIDTLAEQRKEITKQIEEIEKSNAAKKLQIEAQKELAKKQKNTADEIAYQNDKLEEQRILYGQGMATSQMVSDFLQEQASARRQAANDEVALIEELNEEYEKSAAEYIKLEQQKAEAAKKAQKDAATSALGTIQSMAAGVKDESIELFRLYQAAAITNTTMSTYEAATKALTAGPYAGPILAGIIYALGMANVRKIANESPPQRYLGGDVAMNKSYIVGERGPELFTPGRTGTITPNNAISKSTPVLININAVDARGIDSLLHERHDTLVSIINQSLQRQPRRAI